MTVDVSKLTEVSVFDPALVPGIQGFGVELVLLGFRGIGAGARSATAHP